MGISGWQLLIIALIVVLIFGTKKLRNIGSDLGGGLKSFRKAMKDEEDTQDPKSLKDESESGRIIDGDKQNAVSSEKDDSK